MITIERKNMKKYSLFMFAALVAVTTLTTGCFSMDAAGSTYSRDEVKKANKIYMAEIVAIDNVTIEGTSGGVGGLGGALVGGAIGSGIGGGSGNTIATAAGAVGGAILGAKAEEKLTRTAALEITVMYLQTQECEAIVQTAGNDNFQVGDRVRVLVDNRGTKRVRPLSNPAN